MQDIKKRKFEGFKEKTICDGKLCVLQETLGGNANLACDSECYLQENMDLYNAYKKLYIEKQKDPKKYNEMLKRKFKSKKL